MAVLSLERQFLLGSALLVAPVLDPKVERVVAYLPEGVWRHAFTNETFDIEGLAPESEWPKTSGWPTGLLVY